VFLRMALTVWLLSAETGPDFRVVPDRQDLRPGGSKHGELGQGGKVGEGGKTDE
jgi:hypothetical protein